MAVGTDHDNNPLQQDESPNGARFSGEIAPEALRLELDVAYCSEKLLNLEILLMQVAGKANDFEALNAEDEVFSNDYFEKAFELVILSGILGMETKELESFMAALRIEISKTRQNLPPVSCWGKFGATVVAKLHDAEESVKNLQDLLADIEMQSANFERSLSLCHSKPWNDESGQLGNGDVSPTAVKWKLQNVDQQRHVLQMLEKSLARELDLEKKLSESISHEDDLKLRLHYAERELYCMEESIEICFRKMLEAENADELLMGILKELSREIQGIQFSLNGAIQRENEMRARMEESMARVSAEEAAKRLQKASEGGSTMANEDDSKESLKEVKGKLVFASSDVLALRDKVQELESQQKDSNAQLQLANTLVKSSQEQQNIFSSQISQMGTALADLKSDVSRNEKRTESSKAENVELLKTDKQLGEGIASFKNSKSEREVLLERTNAELEMRLEHAKASVEAGEEQRNMLCATIVGMENTIKDLKGKVLKAEKKSESAESKCSLLPATNIDSDAQLQLANTLVKSSQEQQNFFSSQISQMESALADLKSDVSRNEKRAESSEAERTEPLKTDKHLGEDIASLKNSESERETLLERTITELERRLEFAKASVEAGEEQRNMLYTTIVDMENTIKVLKGKVLKAEKKTENAESKCSLLTETNVELSEEVSSLRGRLVSLETSLNQVESAKIATAKDIGIRTKMIGDLVMKISTEREQLQLQVSALKKKNKTLSEKFKLNSCISPSCKEADDGLVSGLSKLAEEMQVVEPAEPMLGGETDTAACCDFETSRNIEATQTDPKYFLTSVIVLLVLVLTFYMYQGSSRP